MTNHMKKIYRDAVSENCRVEISRANDVFKSTEKRANLDFETTMDTARNVYRATVEAAILSREEATKKIR